MTTDPSPWSLWGHAEVAVGSRALPSYLARAVSLAWGCPSAFPTGLSYCHQPIAVVGQGAWSQSGMEDHHCAGDSPAHAVGPRGHGKKRGIVFQNSCLDTKGRLVESQSVGLHESRKFSSCHRKVSDSFLWKLEGRGRGNPAPWWLSIWR